MARIRTVKPEFWEDDKIGSISPIARLTFIACWNIADDEGLLKWNPRFIKARVFPYDDSITVVDSENIMRELTELSLILQYSDQKQQQYGWIVNFRKHQRIDKPQKPKHPAPSLQNRKVKEMYARRDDFLCHICGDEIPLNTNNSSKVLSLDHIVPRSKGGGDYPSNIKIAHFGCNAGKCDKELPECSKNVPSGKGKERKGKEQGKDLDSGTSTLVSSDHVSTQEDLTLLPSLSHTDLTSERKTKRSKAVHAAREAKGARTWSAYSTAYAKRYGRAPQRNGQTNSICVQLVDSLGADLAPLVAAYYLTTNAQPYVGSSHALTLLKRDYQKFATEYETGNRTTQAQARELDRRQGEGDGWRGVIERRGE